MTRHRNLEGAWSALPVRASGRKCPCPTWMADLGPRGEREHSALGLGGSALPALADPPPPGPRGGCGEGASLPLPQPQPEASRGLSTGSVFHKHSFELNFIFLTQRKRLEENAQTLRVETKGGGACSEFC